MRVSSTFGTSVAVSTVSPIRLIFTKNGITGISAAQRVGSENLRLLLSRGFTSFPVRRERRMNAGLGHPLDVAHSVSRRSHSLKAQQDRSLRGTNKCHCVRWAV